METLLTSTAIVAFAEIGDKTQLLAIVLAARFNKPLQIVLGILVATLANHFLAAFLGGQAALFLAGDWFSYLVAISFLFMAAWTLIPDKLDDDLQAGPARYGAFLTTCVAFFLVEIGDKTQVATIALGARFDDLLMVTLGTTLGMMAANVPAILFSNALTSRVPLKAIRLIAAGLLALTGLWLALETFLAS